MHPHVFLALGAAFAILFAGCESAPKVTPNGRVVVPVRAQDDDLPTTKVKLGNEVVVKLPKIAAAGNHWTIVFNDARFLDQRRPIQTSADGVDSVAFVAVHTGRRPLRFLALPTGVREATPTQSYNLIVEIE